MAALERERADALAQLLEDVAPMEPGRVPVWSRPWVVAGLAGGAGVAVVSTAAAAVTGDAEWAYVAAAGLTLDAGIALAAWITDLGGL